jgi:hypothetical protein
MTRRLHRTAATALAVLALAACSEPQPDPEAFWTELSFFTDLSDEYEAQAVDDGLETCRELAAAPSGDDDGVDEAARSWAAWVDQMGTRDAEFFWSTAVEHLCPGQAGTFERVRHAHDAAPAGGS